MKRRTPKTREARVAGCGKGVGGGLAFTEPFQVSRRVVRACNGGNFFRVEKMTSEELRDATTAEPLNANTGMVVAQKRKKKGEGHIRHLYTVGSQRTRYFHFPLMTDLAPDSFQHEAFCSLYMVITRARNLIRLVGAMFLKPPHTPIRCQGSHPHPLPAPRLLLYPSQFLPKWLP